MPGTDEADPVPDRRRMSRCFRTQRLQNPSSFGADPVRTLSEPARPPDQAPIKQPMRLRGRRNIVPLVYQVSSRRYSSGRHLRLRQYPLDRSSKRIGRPITRYLRATPVLKELVRTDPWRGDDGYSGGHRFDERNRHRLVQRGRGREIDALKQSRHVVAKTQKDDVLIDVVLSGDFAQPGLLRPVAGEKELYLHRRSRAEEG